MKKYLSSYKIGNKGEEYKALFGKQKNILYISNALDMVQDLDWKAQHDKSDIQSLEELGFIVELLDLRDYFGEKEKLEQKISKYAGVFVSGGNVFVLNQAYKISGFGEIMQEYDKHNPEFMYAGYSAGVCVLLPSLDGYHIVDDSKIFPYELLKEQIWEGLGIIDFNFSPHYNSNHEESELIEKEILYCIENKILFKALRDGDVLIEE